MKSIITSHRLLKRVTWLLCAGIFAIALPANAKDKAKSKHRHHSKHHYNSHYRGHSHGHRVYSYGYRSRGNYGYSNYGHSHHRTLIIRLFGL